jgi:hypothetical protein
MSDKFMNFSDEEKHLLFEALLHCIRTNSGIGFRSYDQGAPVYEEGARGDAGDGGDSPDRNAFYKMYCELSLHMIDWPAISAFRPVCITDWQQFCKLGLHYHNRLHRKKLIEGAAEEMQSTGRPRL